MNFFDQSNETLNEPLSSLRALNSRKPWIMGWTMGPKMACPKALIFCNKDMSSSLIYGLRSSIEMCCSMVIKARPFSIDFLTSSLNFPFEMNHFFEQDLSNLSNGLECSLGFL
jgi:hypothetical protein